MKLKEIINILLEGFSDILYHYTSMRNLLKILKNDKFILSSSIGTRSDNEKTKGNRLFFMSTGRSLTSYYIRSRIESRNLVTVIELDGRKLGHNYKGLSVDYWGYSKNPKDWKDKEMYKQVMNQSEMEDRIVSKKPEIKNASKYITKILVLLPTKQKYLDAIERMRLITREKKSNEEIQKIQDNLPTIRQSMNDPDIKKLRELTIQAKTKGIPIYFFTEPSDLYSKNYKNAISSKEITWSVEDIKGIEEYSGSSMKPRKVINLISLYHAKDESKLDNKQYELLRNLYYSKKDSLMSLEADAHNEKQSKYVQHLTKLMQKENVSTISDFIDVILKKYNKI